MDFSLWWDRAIAALQWVLTRWHLAAEPPLWVVVLGAVGIAAACTVPPIWRTVRHASTLVHEMGHATMAWVFGRRVAGISVHTDTSGLTITSGRPRGLGVIMTFLAGYTAPPLAGLGLVWASVAGWSGAALTGIALMLVVAFWLTRNLFGLLTVAAALAASGLVWWHGDAATVTAFVLISGMFLLVAGVRGVGDLYAAHRKGEGAESDASMAAQHSLLPASVWVLFFFLVALVSVGQGIVLLVRYFT